MNRELARAPAKALIVILGLLTTNGWCQKITSIDRERAQSMLQEISSDVKKHYYDPTFHRVNWDAKVEEMKQRINAADSMNQALSEVAAALDSLNDSHTFFLPPSHALRYDYGWQAQMIGDRCFVLRVRPGSDAEKKGVKAGDELMETQWVHSEPRKLVEDAIRLQHSASATRSKTGLARSGRKAASGGRGYHHD